MCDQKLIIPDSLKVSERCRQYQIQDCHICDNLECGDNLTEEADAYRRRVPMDQITDTMGGFMLRDKLPLQCPVCNSGPASFRSEKEHAGWGHRIQYSCDNSAQIHSADDPHIEFSKSCKNAYDIIANRKEPNWKVLVQSYTHPEKYYLVQQGKDGRLVCDCPDYVHRGSISGHVCKHTQKAFRVLAGADLLVRRDI